MANFRANKQYIRQWIQEDNWNKNNPLPPEVMDKSEMEIINALFACLPQGDRITKRAAFILGNTIAKVYTHNREQAQICIRRFMWHMNEESGNIGWGIPQAFAQSLAHSAELAKLYHNVLISYVYDRQGDSNFCDYAPLRYACYEGIFIFGLAMPEYRERICTVLSTSQEDDAPCLEILQKIQESFCTPLPSTII